VTGRGTLYVTDSRVLFYASLTQRRGRASALIQETQLQHVTGLMAYVSRSWSWFGFMLTLLIGLVGYAALTGGHALIGIVLLALAAAGVSLLLTGLALRGTVGVRLTSSAAQSSPLGFGALGDPRGGFWRSLLGPFGAVITLIWGPRDATDLLLAMPGPDAERVIVELGALIADLQVRGSLAETHWGRDPEPEDGT
jgi:hypothetical protein